MARTCSISTLAGMTSRQGKNYRCFQICVLSSSTTTNSRASNSCQCWSSWRPSQRTRTTSLISINSWKMHSTDLAISKTCHCWKILSTHSLRMRRNMLYIVIKYSKNSQNSRPSTDVLLSLSKRKLSRRRRQRSLNTRDSRPTPWLMKSTKATRLSQSRQKVKEIGISGITNYDFHQSNFIRCG